MKATRRLIHTGHRVPRGETELDRIAKHIRREANDCCSWNGKPLDRYVQVAAPNGGTTYAHRRVYEALHGHLPSDVHVHHACGNRGCVNPYHLTELDAGDHSAIHAALRAERRGG